MNFDLKLGMVNNMSLYLRKTKRTKKSPFGCCSTVTTFFCFLDPSKHNYQPRLFELSSATGKFNSSEVLCPSRSEPKLCPFPFIQEDLYTAKQPGTDSTSFLPSFVHSFVHLSVFTQVYKQVPVSS